MASKGASKDRGSTRATEPAKPSPTARAKIPAAKPAASPHAHATPTPAAPPPAKPSAHASSGEGRAEGHTRARRTGLKALVPSVYRAEGEEHPFLREYKTKWLSRLDFKSEASVHSLLILAFMVLAEKREAEAEFVATQVVKHVNLKLASEDTRSAVTTAIYLVAYLKAKRGVDAAPLLERARIIARTDVNKDREWLSTEAANEIRDAVARGKVGYLVYPLAGIARWLNDGGARVKAESVLAIALDAMRAFMR